LLCFSNASTAAPADIAERLQPIIDEKRGPAEVVFELEFPGRFTALVRPNSYVKVPVSGARHHLHLWIT